MEWFTELIGEGRDLNTLQMCIRGIIVSIVSLILIRLSGRRSFGMRSSFDNTIVILLGAILSRCVVGASELIPTLSASFIIVIMHRIFAWLSLHNELFGRLIKGKRIILYQDEKILNKNMEKALVNKDDLQESLHCKAQMDDLNDIKAAYMERNGEISVIKKDSSD